MSELPKGWAMGSLNELVATGGLFSDGDWIESKDQDPEGENRLLQLADIGDGIFVDKSSRFVNNEKFQLLNCTELHEGDVLIARMPDPLGRACLMPRIGQRCLTVVDVAIFRSGSCDISHKLLMHFLNSPQIRKAIEIESSGTTRKRIARGKLAELALPIPPAAEQTRIAAKLDELLAQVDTLKARIDGIPALLKRFRQSVLAAAVSGRLTEEWRAQTDYYEHPYAVDWKWPPIPEAWRVKLYSEVVESRLGKMLDKAKNAGIPTKYLGNINVRWFDFNLNEVQEILVSESERNELAINKEDVLICEGGEPGRCAIWDGRFTGSLIFQKALHRARVTGALLPAWLALNLKHDAESLVLEQLFTGTTIKHLTGKALKKYPMRIPPLEEQTEIVRRVEQLFAFADQLEAKVASAKSRIDHLTQSILAKAFRGELVPQDPNDEPANVLLERIKAQRAAAPKAKRGRKASA
ncbi:restriction endonuclease subunit S [Ectopseudomonas mendocina]